ncbi:MAG: hypothetical protein ACRDI2_00350 [Chloroflexota bacterium]
MTAPLSTTRSEAPSATPRDYNALAARIRAAAHPPLTCRVYGQQVTPDGAERYDLLLVRIRAVGRTAFRVLLNGGTHGDEPAGVEAVTRFLEAERYRAWLAVDFTVTPCTNPWGYAADRREGPGGRDLNRSFRRAGKTTPEISLLKRALAGRHFDLFVDCHEDVDAPGLYVFAPSALGRAIVAAAAEVGPVHPGPAVDGEIPLKESVVELDAERAGPRRRTWSTWPLPFYIARYHQRGRTQTLAQRSVGDARETEAENMLPPDIGRMPSATIETPTCLPLQQRVAMHLAAIDAALSTLRSDQVRRPGI